MYGHEGATRDLTDRIAERLPVRIASIRTERGATSDQLPMPARVRPHWVTAIDADRYPYIAVTELDTPTGLVGSRGIHNSMPYSSFTYRYPFRIWVYVSGRTYGDTELQLKRYLTAIREVLLENLVLVDHNVASVFFDTETIAENFFPPEETARDVLGAGFVGVVLVSTEVVNPAGVVIPIEGPVPAPTGPYHIESDIAPLRRATPGRWQDVGTWNTADPNLVPDDQFDPNDLP